MIGCDDMVSKEEAERRIQEEVEARTKDLQSCLADRTRDCTQLRTELERLKSQLDEIQRRNTPPTSDPELIKLIDDKVKDCIGEECLRLREEEIPKQIEEYHRELWEEQQRLEEEQKRKKKKSDPFCLECSLKTDHDVAWGTEGCNHAPRNEGDDYCESCSYTEGRKLVKYGENNCQHSR